MKVKNWQDQLKVLLPILLFGLFFLFSQNLRLVDSEIWSFYLAKNWNPLDGHFAGFFWKPLQVLFIRLIAFLAPGAELTENHLAIGRFFWALLFLAQLLFLARCARRLQIGYELILFGLGVLFVSRYYLVENLHCRADSLASLFLVYAMWEILRGLTKEKRNGEPSVKALTMAIFFVSLSSLKFLPQALLLCLTAAVVFPKQRRVMFWVIGINLGLVLLTMTLAFAFDNSRRVMEILLQSWLDAGTSLDKYRENWVFTKDQIIYFLPLWILSLALLGGALGKKSEVDRINKFLALFALLNSLVVLLHPEPYPWYAATTVPFHVLCVLRLMKHSRTDSWISRYNWQFRGLAIFLVIIGFINAFQNHRGMRKQMAAIEDLRTFADVFQIDTFYDNCGLISDRKHILPFITAGQQSDIMAAQMMFLDEGPDLIIRTARTVLLLPKLEDAISRNYLVDTKGMGIMIKKSQLEKKSVIEGLNGQSPSEAFLNYPWKEAWQFDSLFSPYLGYSLW